MVIRSALDILPSLRSGVTENLEILQHIDKRNHLTYPLMRKCHYHLTPLRIAEIEGTDLREGHAHQVAVGVAV